MKLYLHDYEIMLYTDPLH